MLKVYLYGHPVLRRQSGDITPDYPGLKQLVADMYDSMYASSGVGLAAPQIGRNDRIVVIDASPLGDDFPECVGRKLTLINPRVEVLEGEKVTRSEGCLSLPGLSENVPRVEKIRLTWSMRISLRTRRLSKVFSHVSCNTSATIWRASCT